MEQDEMKVLVEIALETNAAVVSLEGGDLAYVQDNVARGRVDVEFLDLDSGIVTFGSIMVR